MTQNELAQSGKDGYYHAPTDEWFINGTGPLYPPAPILEPIKTQAPTVTEAPRIEPAAKPQAEKIDDKKAGKK